jgi:hypothetical protein
VVNTYQLVLHLQPEGDDAGITIKADPEQVTDEQAQEQALAATEAITEGRAICILSDGVFFIIPAETIRYAQVRPVPASALRSLP